MAFRFETANERWKWYKQSVIDPMDPSADASEQRIRLEEKLAALDQLFDLSWSLAGGNNHALEDYSDAAFEELLDDYTGGEIRSHIEKYLNYLKQAESAIFESGYKEIINVWIPTNKAEADFRKNILDAIGQMSYLVGNAVLAIEEQQALPNEDAINSIAQLKDWFNQSAKTIGRQHEDIARVLRTLP